MTEIEKEKVYIYIDSNDDHHQLFGVLSMVVEEIEYICLQDHRSIIYLFHFYT